MPKQLLQYDLLISCPGDVQSETIIIRECISKFNKTIGTNRGYIVSEKHWSTHSYPESGGKPQSLLNEQFVLDCDLAVAVFWTKFGTPTDEYDSGTEEEIEELLKSGKQVFLYFSDCPVTPSSVKAAQYDKITAFREKYKDRGIYFTYSNLEKFRELFFDHLSLYFQKVITEDTMAAIVIENNTSSLAIVGTSNNEIIEETNVYRTKYLDSGFLDKQKNIVMDKLNEVSSFVLPPREQKPIRKNVLSQMSIFDQPLEDFLVSDNIKSTIHNFMKEAMYDYDELEFFNIGNLQKKIPIIASPLLNNKVEIIGTDDEKKKHALIVDVYWGIRKLNEYKDFFSVIDSKYMLDLALTNNGTKYDEDIDVKLFFEKGCLCPIGELPIPGDEVIQQGDNFFRRIYTSTETPFVSEFPNRPMYPPLYSGGPTLFGESHKEVMEKERKKYQNNLKTIFCYSFYEGTAYSAITYNQSYLKQGTTTHFPARIVLNYNPEKISYEISSKHSPKVIKGELDIGNNL